MLVSLLFVVIFALLIVDVWSHPEHLECSNPLAVNSVIMGSPAVSSNSRSLIIKRGSTVLNSGDSYVAGEVLTVSSSATTGCLIYETENGNFGAGGRCNGLRFIPSANEASLTMPKTGTVKVKMGFALQYGTVSITDSFVLTAPAAVVSPTVSSVPAPTASMPPTYYTAASNTEDSNLVSYPSSMNQNLAVGLIIGVLGFVFVCLSVKLYLVSYEKGNMAMIHYVLSFPISSILAIIFAGAALGLVSAWAQNHNTSTQFGFLNKPNWDNNVAAWHPVLMVGGFFFSQVVAICSWSLFSHQHAVGKVFHVFFQLAAMSTMIAGLCAMVHHLLQMKAESLTTMHSWVGVAAVSVFGVTFLWGAGMSTLTAFHPESLLRKAFDLRRMHQTIGLTAFGLTTVAILTGINNSLGQGACAYVITTSYTYKADVNPAENYGSLPKACKIANGMGICVLLAAVCVFIAVSNRPASSPSAITADKETNAFQVVKSKEEVDLAVA
mmetsp:Transcript_32442/g.46781  ORF Transcript_32442/g.46781 Transcript_32442/m.46781 type:complete len:495 (+) Transcript_32442:26-1510(+)